MKKILIIYPHFPPSNLAGVHRPRLFAQHLPGFGWEPVILTVDESFYEERLDHNLVKLLPNDLRIEKVSAFGITKPRLIADIGLRAFFQMYKKAIQLIRDEKFDFVFIPIPSFYTALLGRMLHERTGIQYGIDYIDPWVHHFPGSDRIFSRHWFSSKLARLLEPIAVKKAALITGVAEGYYKPVFVRNPALKDHALSGAMPYGGEPEDHHKANELEIDAPMLFQKNNAAIQLVYAGAMLPKAYEPLEAIFRIMADNRSEFKDVEFHFIGTGKTPNDVTGYNIKPLAEKYELWQTTVFEYPARISYFDVLAHLKLADGIFILGSTEAHYTPSKSYQAVLSGKPIFAVLKDASTAVEALGRSRAARVLSFGEDVTGDFNNKFVPLFREYKNWIPLFRQEDIDLSMFDAYSAKAVTQQLTKLLNSIVEGKKYTHASST